METNWYSIGGVLLFVVVLIVFLVKRNLKDKKKLEEFLEWGGTKKDITLACADKSKKLFVFLV